MDDGTGADDLFRHGEVTLGVEIVEEAARDLLVRLGRVAALGDAGRGRQGAKEQQPDDQRHFREPAGQSLTNRA